MIAPSRSLELESLLLAGRHTRRQIARRLRLSLTVVCGAAQRLAAERDLAAAEAADVRFRRLRAAQRCAKCGKKIVVAPCVACAARAA